MKASMRLLTIMLIWFCSAAMADDHPVRTTEEIEAVFHSLDRNDDERLSRAEAAKEETLRERFAGVDASGDGYLNLSEYIARPSDEPFE